MNSTKASSVKRRYSSAPFFGFTLDHGKYQFALYLIVVLLTMILPCLFAISRADLRPTSVSSRIRFVEDTMMIVVCLGFVASCIIALFSGMGALSYVNSKKAVGCYHSLPVRRESIFFSETVIRVIFYLIAIVIGYLVAYFMIIGAVPQGVIYTNEYIRYALSSVVVFMYVYSVMLVAAGLCGTAFMRFAMSGIILFLPCIIYLLVFSTVTMGVDNNTSVNAVYHMNAGNMKYAFSFIRVIDSVLKVKESMAGILTVVLESIAYYAIALILHKYRRSEQSETTVIWKPVFIVVKYALMVSASLLGMYVFGTLFGDNDAFGIFLGAFIGIVIAFITVNSIMYKSSRMMFNGMKSFATVCLMVLIYIFFVPLNATGRIGTPYSAGNTESLTVKVNGTKIEYTDKEDIEMILDSLETSARVNYDSYPKFSGMLKSACSETLAYYFESYMYFDQNEYDGEEYMIPYTSDTLYVAIEQDPKIGVILGLNYEFSRHSEFFDALWRTDEYVNAYNFTSLAEGGFVVEDVTVDFCSTNFVLGQDAYAINGHVKEGSFLDSDKLLELLCELELKKESVGDSPLVGVIKITARKGEKIYRTFEYPIYANDTDVLLGTGKLVNTVYNDMYGLYLVPYGMESAEEYYSATSDIYTSYALVHLTSGEAKLLTSEELTSLAPYTANFCDVERGSDVSEYVDISASEYMIVALRRSKYSNYSELSEIRFRSDAITDEKLKEIFDALEN